MKLNKKGFGVAEIAIVILLIGILAAAVIAGFMGIKKNASEHVKEEATKSAELIHATKHAYPIVIAKNQSGFAINEGEYEVYDLSGHTITNTGMDALDPTIYNNGGQLFINGNGGTIYRYSNSTASANRFTGPVVQEGEGAELELNNVELVFTGVSGGYSYAASIYSGKATFNNVTIKSGAGLQVAYGAEVIYNTKNDTFVMDMSQTGTGWYCFNNYDATVIVNGGTFIIKNGHTYLNVTDDAATTRYETDDAGNTLTDDAGNPIVKPTTTIINGGIFKQAGSSGVAIYQYFRVGARSELIINGGTFTALNSLAPIINFVGAGTVEINGGEFLKAPSAFVTGDAKDKGTVIITGGTFHFDPDIYNWRRFVDETVYDIDDSVAGVWKVIPKTN